MTDRALARELREKLSKAAGKAEAAVILAENTDLSPNQAERLVERCRADLERMIDEAVLFKAEG